MVENCQVVTEQKHKPVKLMKDFDLLGSVEIAPWSDG